MRTTFTVRLRAVVATPRYVLCAFRWLPRVRLKYLEMLAYTITILGMSRGQTAKGLRSGLACRQQLQHWQQLRKLSLWSGTQNLCSKALLKDPLPVYRSLSVLSSFLRRKSSGKTACSSSSAGWITLSSSASALANSGEAQTTQQLWEEYFSDPSQWCDNRVVKRNPRSPDFHSKATKNALWVDSWSTPSWVKARLKLASQGRSQTHPGKGTLDFEGTELGTRLPTDNNGNKDTLDFEGTELGTRLPPDNNGNKDTLPTSARELRPIVHGGGGSMHMHSACTTSEAIAILKYRIQKGMDIDSYMYVEILKRCLNQKNFSALKHVHDCITKSGMDKDKYVASTLLNVYIGCGRLQDARRVFDKLETKNVVTWTIMIGGYAKNNHAEDALEVFNRMRQGGLQPNAITYLSILQACASPSALNRGKEVHTYIRHAGLESDVRVGTALVNMYAKCGCITEAKRVFENLPNRTVFTSNVMLGAYAASGSIDDARLVFDRMEKRDVLTWTRMIGAYAESGQGAQAYGLFLEMRREGFKPDAITYISILNAAASAGALEWVKKVHGYVRKAGLESDLRVWNALVHMYAKSGSIDDARRVFDGMAKRNVITWSTMIGGLAQYGCGQEALQLFRKMDADCVRPDATTFVAVLSACSHAGLVDEGRRLFLAMTEDFDIKPTVLHYTCMVDLLGRAGHLEEAKLFIGEMPGDPDVAAWGALLGACRIHGNVELGELAAKKLLELEPKNVSAYLLLSNIYAAASRWELVSLLRTVMQGSGIRKEPGRSWIEVDDKIHEFFAGDTSHPEAKAIYADLNKLTERLKMEGYIPDTQLVLQNVEEEDKELALCCHSEKLAIAYGLMRTPAGQPIRIFKNLRVCSDCHTASKLISRVTGREIIARDANRFHHFRDGVCSCGDYW